MDSYKSIGSQSSISTTMLEIVLFVLRFDLAFNRSLNSSAWRRRSFSIYASHRFISAACCLSSFYISSSPRPRRSSSSINFCCFCVILFLFSAISARYLFCLSRLAISCSSAMISISRSYYRRTSMFFRCYNYDIWTPALNPNLYASASFLTSSKASRIFCLLRSTIAAN